MCVYRETKTSLFIMFLRHFSCYISKRILLGTCIFCRLNIGIMKVFEVRRNPPSPNESQKNSWIIIFLCLLRSKSKLKANNGEGVSCQTFNKTDNHLKFTLMYKLALIHSIFPSMLYTHTHAPQKQMPHNSLLYTCPPP